MNFGVHGRGDQYLGMETAPFLFLPLNFMQIYHGCCHKLSRLIDEANLKTRMIFECEGL